MLVGEDRELQQVATIKVAGIGGGGQNAVEHMINEKISGVTFLCANTDLQALQRSSAHVKLQLGEEITKGLGAGANPEIGKEAALENMDQLKQAIAGSDMLFITAGMGGGTGTGGAPVVAQIAKEMGVLTVAVVTKPFLFEGKKRMDYALEGITELRKHVDSLIIIPNNKLLSVLGKNVTLLSAFRAANAVLQGAVEGISNLVTRPGLINVDFADVRTVMSEMGMAMMGTGSAQGEDRARIAAESAVSSPLLEDIDLSGAKGVLVNITAGSDMSIGEFEIVGDTIREFTSNEATVVVGTAIDPDMCDEMRVTIVVTGLDENQSSMQTDFSGAAGLGVRRSHVFNKSESRHDRVRSKLSGSSPSLRQQTTKDSEKKPEETDKYLDIPAFLRQHEMSDE